MRIAYLTVSDQLGGSEVALLETIKGVRRLRPDWSLQVVLPGRGPLFERAEAAGADCMMLPLPGALARVGESSSQDASWSAVSLVTLGIRLIPVAVTLPAYQWRLDRLLRANRAAIVHSNGLKAHVLAARASGG